MIATILVLGKCRSLELIILCHTITAILQDSNTLVHQKNMHKDGMISSGGYGFCQNHPSTS